MNSLKTEKKKSFKKFLKELEIQYRGGEHMLKRDGFGIVLTEEEMNILISDEGTKFKCSPADTVIITFSGHDPVIVRETDDRYDIYPVNKKFKKSTLDKLMDSIQERYSSSED